VNELFCGLPTFGFCFQKAKAKNDEVLRIINQCRAAGRPYEDPDFPANASSLYPNDAQSMFVRGISAFCRAFLLVFI